MNLFDKKFRSFYDILKDSLILSTIDQIFATFAAIFKTTSRGVNLRKVKGQIFDESLET